MAGFSHMPVLPSEVLAALCPHPDGMYIDGTLGGGGHAAAVLEASSPNGRLLGIDADPAALAAAAQRLAPFGERFVARHGNFRDLAEIAADTGITRANGILLDLGVSSYQLDTPERGFSFQHDAPLDMRLDPDADTSAADLVNRLPETQLADLIYQFGEERASRRIARLICEERRRSRIERTTQLAAIVTRALGGRHGAIHPATRTFQALRIAVNGELDALREVIPQAIGLLAPGGRLAIISFHSLEDRIVKHMFREAATGGEAAMVRIITPKPIEAHTEEQRANPRSRSAKLRVVERSAG